MVKLPPLLLAFNGLIKFYNGLNIKTQQVFKILEHRFKQNFLQTCNTYNLKAYLINVSSHLLNPPSKKQKQGTLQTVNRQIQILYSMCSLHLLIKFKKKYQFFPYFGIGKTNENFKSTCN